MAQLNLVNRGRKIVLATLGAAAIAAPVIFSLMHALQVRAQPPQTATTPSLTFDVASIKPDRSSGRGINISISFSDDGFTATGVTVKDLIEAAYEVRDFQVSGTPDWAGSDKFTVNAKMDEQTMEAFNKLTPGQKSGQRPLMVRALLEERFRLKLSHANKELPIYALVLAGNGPKLSSSIAVANDGPSFRKNGEEATVKGATMTSFAEWLSRFVGRKVVDKTGLAGKYDFTLHWTQEKLSPAPGSAADSAPRTAPVPTDSGPSLFTALQQQLGLKLESQKGPVETLIIDSVEKPTEN